MTSTSRTPALVWDQIRSIVDKRPSGTEVAVTVYDTITDETLSIDGEKDFASASTIKILILTALARAFDEGRLHPTDKRSAPSQIRLEGSGVVNWLDTNLELTLKDHAWLMTAISDNTTSNVCIDAVGLDEINAVGRDIGVGGTQLGRLFIGSDAPTGPSKNRATTDGLVAILKAIENDSAASPAQCAWMRQCLDDQQHRDRLPRHLPESVSYRGKTGSIERIVHDCGVLYNRKRKVVLAVLTEGFENPYDAERLIGRIGTAAAELVTG